MNKYILLMNDEFLTLHDLKKHQTIKEKIPKNTVINGKVANINKFIQKYEDILKKHNLNNSLLGDKLKIVVHPKYTSTDITLIKNIFEKLNYRKITIDNELKYYKLDNKSAWINANNNYLLLSYINEYDKKESFLIENNFFLTIDDLFKYLKKRIENRDVYLIGSGEIFENLYQKFENIYKNKVYTFSNSNDYILDCLTNL